MVSSFFFINRAYIALTFSAFMPIGCDAASFLQLRKPSIDPSAPTLLNEKSKATCTDLKNHGTHFTVDIEVGTPPQKFSVVADTGSNSLIIPSCVCQQRGYCSKSDRCFTGTNRSASFSLKNGPKGSMQSIFVTFGSGTIEAIIAKEKVTVGHLPVDMNDGLLLMVARNLNIAGQFEGILGLGLPSAKKVHKKHSKHNGIPANSEKSEIEKDKLKEMLKKILGGIMGGGEKLDPSLTEGDAELVPMDEVWESPTYRWRQPAQLSQDVVRGLDDIGDIVESADADLMMPAVVPGLAQHRHVHSEDPEEISGPTSLLEQAGISRFSMCFNDGTNGVLNLGTPEMSDSLSSVGQFHWGLDFRGISVGDGESAAPLSICSTENMTDGQETPCGAIPDSGTTVIMAPKDHLSSLLDSICDQWPRCAQNYSAMVEAAEKAKQSAASMYSFDPFDITPAAKSAVLQLLLLDCGSWMNEVKGPAGGLGELPPLKFHMAGAKGKEKTLELPGWAYVLESTRADAEDNKQLQGMYGDVVFLQNVTSHASKVCSPAFGVMDYNTQKNGPVWILGTPFFYQFHVGYDLKSKPPSISFTSTEVSPCVSCGQQASLLDSSSKETRRPRWISGPIRVPDMDMELPL